jgi:hypothetical protein
MRKRAHVDAADVAGISRLGVEGTAGITDIVEEVHSAVLENVLPGTPSNRLWSNRRRTFTRLFGWLLEPWMADWTRHCLRTFHGSPG